MSEGFFFTMIWHKRWQLEHVQLPVICIAADNTKDEVVDKYIRHLF